MKLRIPKLRNLMTLRVEIAKIKPREILSRQNREILSINKVCEILYITDVSAL